ncbi:MAG: CheR family methyltransferase [Candidatus Omnitrophota bacterium]|jgi:chemotaxis methyl-accepting protein methylase
MADKFKNIMEDIALDVLDKTLASRYDVCTCQECINSMMAGILSELPAKYVSTDKEALNSIIAQTRIEKEAEVARAVLRAIETVMKKPPHKLKDDKNQAFQLLLDKIFEDRGMDFRHYHQSILKRRVGLRMLANNVDSFSDYLMFLIKHPQEYDKLFAVLCINVSEFFRDPDVWGAAEALIRKVIEQKSRENKKLVIWSAACANGEEPYSIAIIVQELLKSQRPIPVEIHATDIDPKALRVCKSAEYAKNSLKNVKPEYLERYFTSQNALWKLKPEIQGMVSFDQLDLIASEYIKETDIVFCRNVFIYFSRSLQDQLLMKFYRSLNTGGYLVLGKSETMWIEAQEIFGEVDAKARIYTKKSPDTTVNV